MKTAELPEVTDLRVEGHQVLLAARMPEELLYFRGHFPDTAILPGVVQIHWAMLWGRQYLNIDGRFAGMTQVKFHLPVRPGDRLQVSLNWHAGDSLLFFQYSLCGRTVSSGRIRVN